MVTTDYLDRILTHQSVNGVSGNAYKGFRTIIEAQDSYNGWVEFLAQRARRGPRVQAPISASQPRVPAPAPRQRPRSPLPSTPVVHIQQRPRSPLPSAPVVHTHSPAPVVHVHSPAPLPPGLGSLRDNPSPTLSDASSLGLGRDPWFVVAEGERPGVYHNRCAFSLLILSRALKLFFN